MMICFLEGPLVVILIRGFSLFRPLTMLFTWSIFWAFNEGKVFLIFKTSDVETDGLEAWAYDFPDFDVDDALEDSTGFFFIWKYFEIMLISFFDLAGKGGRGGALLMVTGVDFGISFLLLLLEAGAGIFGVNFDEILALRVFDLLSV